MYKRGEEKEARQEATMELAAVIIITYFWNRYFILF